ncbi:DUF3422 family protein [Massilia sp. TS11]|uniref:DUF3422 family protein n=1 Tax=Massilia sp. TS11 TaxID=2908003 RepID=UPI001ED9F11F|nr:DUF3422 domain-containing protein [Massilia sp. TS11]MCG2584753.1 DUF3422 domain-containing protein [Massilia sp. TS11]
MMSDMMPAMHSLNHALRVPLAAEIHSRPFLSLDGPTVLSHLAILPGPAAPSPEALLASLCLHFGVAAPAEGARHAYLELGGLRLKWERHTEFCSFSFARPLRAGETLEAAFAASPRQSVPGAWLADLAGSLLVAADVVLVQDGLARPAALAAIQPVFGARMLVGAQVMQGAELWTDFAIHADGVSRFVLRDVGMRELQAGRLVQRVLEIDTYRMMALLGLPAAHSCGAALKAMEQELAELTSAMVAAQDGGADEDVGQAMLEQITRLAAHMEKLALAHAYRFSAAAAYFRLVKARIEELREQRIEGVPTVGEFMERRLAPAMDTCCATAARLAAVGQRIDRTNDLLRTRVNVMQERQNRRILQSLNARAAQQLYLQQAVEGLSVAAITYYVVGVVSYLGKALKAAGVGVNVELLTGASVPLAAGLVWLSLRRLHQRMPAH